MKFVAFHHNGQPGVGLLSNDSSMVEPFDIPLHQRALGALPIIEMLAEGVKLPTLLAPIALKELRVTAPIPKPRRNIFCVGKNYHAHAKEFAGSGFDSSAKSGGDVPTTPIIFSKVPECVIASGEAIVIPAAVSTAIDYEAELAVIIGRGGKGGWLGGCRSDWRARDGRALLGGAGSEGKSGEGGGDQVTHGF